MSSANKVNAVEIEKLRLECFCEMVVAMGWNTLTDWRVGTSYTVEIYTGFFRKKIIQVLSRETDPTKPVAKKEWLKNADCFTMAALTSLYSGALECALAAKHVNLSIDDPTAEAVMAFPRNLPLAISAFPVRYKSVQGVDTFSVIKGGPLTERDLEITEFVCPGIVIHRTTDFSRKHRYSKYLHLYLEKYFGGIQTPYASININVDELAKAS